MIINRTALWPRSRPPINYVLTEKEKAHGVSHGLTEAGYDTRMKQTVRFFLEGGYAYEPSKG